MSEKPSTPDAKKPEEKDERKEAAVKAEEKNTAKNAKNAAAKGARQAEAVQAEDKAERGPPPREEKQVPKEKPGHAAKQTPGRSRGAGAGFIALLIAVLAAGGVVYLWLELQKLSRELVTAQADRLEELRQAQNVLRNEIENHRTAINTLQGGNTGLAASQRALEEGLNGVREQLGQDRSEWAINEVEYLLRVGNRRLQLARDVGSAIAALEAADRRLLNQGDPAFLPVREHIAVELQSLRNIARLDVEGTAAKLTGLAATVGELPLLGETVRRDAMEAPSQGDAEDGWSWSKMGKDFGQWVRSLVVIRHGRKDVRPLLAAEEAFFLRQNLRLKLETARLALLEGNTTIYQAALDEAAAWLREYFDKDAPAVMSSLESVGGLASLDISPTLPDISDSLRVLREIRSTLQGSRKGNADEEGAP